MTRQVRVFRAREVDLGRDTDPAEAGRRWVAFREVAAAQPAGAPRSIRRVLPAPVVGGGLVVAEVTAVVAGWWTLSLVLLAAAVAVGWVVMVVASPPPPPVSRGSRVMRRVYQSTAETSRDEAPVPEPGSVVFGHVSRNQGRIGAVTRELSAAGRPAIGK